MDDAELEALLVDVESSRSERTISGTKTEKFGEAICAFANDLPGSGKPGYLFVGANPDGTACGLAITDQLLQTLAAFRSDGNLLPPPSINVEKRELGGAEMAVVEVLPSELPPVRFKGTTWVRVGSSRARASEADERVLSERRAALARSWDAQACGESALDDLAMHLFEAYKQAAIARDVLEENHRQVADQLASLRLVDRRSGKPTNAAILLLGKDPLYFFPGAYVQFVAYDGANQGSNVLKERRLTGDLGSLLRELNVLVEALSVARPIAISGAQEKTIFDYPPAALRELFVNAIIHRDYVSNTPTLINQFSDRIEIVNAGGLYDLKPEDLGRVTAYRNPIIAEAARNLGFVNRFGRGIPRAREALAANGSPAPNLEPHANHFLATIPRLP